MQGHRLLLAAISGLVISTISMPASAMMSIPNGWYLEGNAGWSHISNKTYPGSSSRSGVAGNANLGYKLMPYFGIEAGYSRYADTTIKNSIGTKAATDQHYAVDLALKGIVPFADSGFEMFAKLGGVRVASNIHINNSTAAAGLGLTSNQHNSTGIYAGLGAAYYLMPELSLVVQWQHAQGSNSTGNFDLYTGGLNFIFG